MMGCGIDGRWDDSGWIVFMMLWCFQQNVRYYTFDLKCDELLLFLYVFKLDGFLQKEVNQAILPENVFKKIIADSLFFYKIHFFTS